MVLALALLLSLALAPRITNSSVNASSSSEASAAGQGWAGQESSEARYVPASARMERKSTQSGPLKKIRRRKKRETTTRVGGRQEGSQAFMISLKCRQ